MNNMTTLPGSGRAGPGTAQDTVTVCGAQRIAGPLLKDVSLQEGEQFPLGRGHQPIQTVPALTVIPGGH